MVDVRSFRSLVTWRGSNRRRIAVTSSVAVAALAAVVGTALSAGTSETSASFEDKASTIHMQITNNTNEKLILGKYNHSGTVVHWHQQPTDLDPGQSEIIDVYAAGDPSVYVDYTGASSSTSWQLTGSVPSFGSNTWGATSSNPDFSATMQGASGYTPTFSYDLHWGRTFNYTGTSDTITIPQGVTKIQYTADGGAGGDPFTKDETGINDYMAIRPLGAHMTGTIDVTPGEKLTVAVGGRGNAHFMDSSSYEGGWSLDGYRGGTGGAFSNHVAGGGGATVIMEGDQPLLIAGGGGGSYGNVDPNLYKINPFIAYGWGGRGDYAGGPSSGYNGQNYVGTDGGGGQSGSKQQDDGNTDGNGVDADADSGGAGGGGFVGGGAGPKHDTGGGGGMSWHNERRATGDASSPVKDYGDRYEQTGQITIRTIQ